MKDPSQRPSIRELFLNFPIMAVPTFKLLEKYEPIKNLLEEKSFSIRYYIPEKDTNVLIIAEKFKDIDHFIG